jgi:hypothetical protein
MAWSFCGKFSSAPDGNSMRRAMRHIIHDAEEAVANIKEAMEFYIEGLIEDGQPVPDVKEIA